MMKGSCLCGQVSYAIEYINIKPSAVYFGNHVRLGIKKLAIYLSMILALIKSNTLK